jgi:uncharacterized Zn-binding protein involved in type VI secretion
MSILSRNVDTFLTRLLPTLAALLCTLLCTLLATLICTSLTTPAWAGDPALAQDLFDEGQTLLEAGNVEEACKKFSASMEAEPSGGTALNLGRCHEKLGRTASAWAEYKRAISLLRTTRDADRLKFAEEQSARLAPTLSKLTIDAEPMPGLVVEKDGVVVEEGGLGVALVVDPGERAITASAPGYKPWSTTVTVGTTADSYSVSIPALEEDPDAVLPGADNTADTLIVTGGVLAGIGGVAAIVGGALGGTVLADENKLAKDCAPAVNEGDKRLCSGDAEEIRQRAETNALVSNILLIGGGAIAAGGAVLLIIGLTSDDGAGASDEMAFVPMLGPGQVGAVFTTSF